MANRPRGDCLIINNVKFKDGTERKGADVDERELKDIFEMLSFTVTVCKNLDRDDMRKKATKFAEKDHSQHDGFVMVVMSHGGSRDVIYGVDEREIRVEELMSEFKAKNSPTLRDKPKMFFIQSCRGKMEDTSSVPMVTSNTDTCKDEMSADSTLPNTSCPQEADFLLAFSTSPGYVALRNKKNGSWFMQVSLNIFFNFINIFNI